MSAEISIFVQVMKYPSKHDIRLAFPLSESLIRETFVPVDLPDEHANGIERMFCTPAVEIAKVKMNRKKMAKMLAEVMTEKIMEIMDTNDTVMGYER